MSTTIYECGCTVTRDMHTGEPLSVRHCEGHWYLLSADKTVRQMADELADPSEHEVVYMIVRGEMTRRFKKAESRYYNYLTGTGQ